MVIISSESSNSLETSLKGNVNACSKSQTSAQYTNSSYLARLCRRSYQEKPLDRFVADHCFSSTGEQLRVGPVSLFVSIYGRFLTHRQRTRHVVCDNICPDSLFSCGLSLTEFITDPFGCPVAQNSRVHRRHCCCSSVHRTGSQENIPAST